MTEDPARYLRHHAPFRFDTTPGSGGPLAPRAGFSGHCGDYRDQIRDRYQKDPEARTALLLAARAIAAANSFRAAIVTGPWQYEGAQILGDLAAWLKQPSPAQRKEK